MRTLTAAAMREADRRCIEELGMPGAVLMNNAGMAVFKEIAQDPVGVVCGKGNNGGDGYVVARLALLAGFAPRVVLTARVDEIRGDARTFLELYRNLGGILIEAPGEEEAARAVTELADCGVLVDALLGTGISGEVRGPVRGAIEAWPDRPTIAVDIPSGMHTDTGVPGGCCIRADVTVTFQWAKRGFLNPEAKPYLGRLVVADIGIPDFCADDEKWAEYALRPPKDVSRL